MIQPPFKSNTSGNTKIINSGTVRLTTFSSQKVQRQLIKSLIVFLCPPLFPFVSIVSIINDGYRNERKKERIVLEGSSFTVVSNCDIIFKFSYM